MAMEKTAVVKDDPKPEGLLKEAMTKVIKDEKSKDGKETKDGTGN